MGVTHTDSTNYKTSVQDYLGSMCNLFSGGQFGGAAFRVVTITLPLPQSHSSLSLKKDATKSGRVSFVRLSTTISQGSLLLASLERRAATRVGICEHEVGFFCSCSLLAVVKSLSFSPRLNAASLIESSSNSCVPLFTYRIVGFTDRSPSHL